MDPTCSNDGLSSQQRKDTFNNFYVTCNGKSTCNFDLGSIEMSDTCIENGDGITFYAIYTCQSQNPLDCSNLDDDWCEGMTRDDISSQAVTYDLIIMAIFAFNIAYLRQMEHIDESEVNDELI